MEHRTASNVSRWTAVILVIAGTLAGCGSAATSSPTTTTGEPTGWRAPAVFSTPPDTGTVIEPVSANPSDLTAHGYVEQEYFASGTAHSFTSRSTPSDGKWTIAVAGSAPYRT
ncbi:MAG TPA: alpha/beta hydrolase domain-containing protein, partial [Acidimicrobiales bacterium]